jgi:hypothetical protein
MKEETGDEIETARGSGDKKGIVLVGGLPTGSRELLVGLSSLIL